MAERAAGRAEWEVLGPCGGLEGGLGGEDGGATAMGGAWVLGLLTGSEREERVSRCAAV